MPRSFKPALLFFISSLLFLVDSASAQTDSASFLLHKFAQHIGKETYYRKDSAGLVQYDINFKFTDRGAPVPLTAHIKITPQYEPVSLLIKGQTSRFSTINDSVVINGAAAHIKVDDSIYARNYAAPMFTVSGYSPGTAQMLLLNYWRTHNEPKTIELLPSGHVSISQDGYDTLHPEEKTIILKRYVIKGLVWGNELVWTDMKDHLFCLITNDAEGDKLEMMWSPYEDLLPEMLSRGAFYGMRLFTSGLPANSLKQYGLTAITGGNVLDVKKGILLPNQVILIQKGIIIKTGPAGSIAVPKNAIIIKADGKTIIPGLWDMHAHFEQAEWGPAYLAAGVTTVRDCGNEFVYINAVKGAIDEGKGIGPHIIKAGIIDGPGEMGLGIVRATTKEEAIAAVDNYKANGFEQIKIYSSVRPPIVKAICDEAHRLGISVTGHIPNGMNILQGIDSGMNQVNHLQYVYAAMKKNKDRSVNFEDSISVNVLKKLKEKNAVIDPTMGVFELIFRSVKDPITDLEPAYYTLPEPLQVLFKNSGSEPDQAEKLKPIYSSFLQIIKTLNDRGITMVAGTDMGFPGFSLDRELELYVQAGLTPAEAIRTATITPAMVMNKDKEYGSIEAGKRADIVIIDGNPLNNIREIRKVRLVIKDGKTYDPVALHKMAGFVK